MAKPLPSPSPDIHPLTRLLDASAAAGAVARGPVVAAPPSSVERATVSPTSGRLIKRECVLTPAADESLARLTELVRRTTGARVNASHAIRALLHALRPVWPRLEDELRALAPLRVPSNARGFERERAQLERQLAAAVLRAFHSSPPEC